MVPSAGRQVEVLLVYRKDRMDEMPPFMLMLNQSSSGINGLSDMRLQNESVSLFDKGIVYAYPLGLRDVETGLSELQDVVHFLISRGLTNKVLGYASGPLAGYLLSHTVVRSNALFSGAVIHNGLFDPLLQYSTASSPVYSAFGDLSQESTYETYRTRSLLWQEHPPLLDNTLLTYD